MTVRVSLLVPVIVSSLFLGCDATSTAPQPEVVVESFQVAGEPFGDVRLTRSVPAGEVFSPTETGIRGADVVIDRIDPDGSLLERYPFVPDTEQPGRYRPVEGTARVVPSATYRLRALLPDGGRVSATTTVPGALSIVQVLNPRAVYQGPSQPSLTVTRSGSAETQNYFVFTVTSLLDFNTLSEQELVAELTPLYADAFDAEDDPISEFRINPSPVLNESNYDVNPDGTITIDLPWIAVAFYGPNRTAINVIDTNYFDFLRTQQVQQGARPGEIPNVLDRVDGGTGLFGSIARVEQDLLILRPGSS